VEKYEAFFTRNFAVDSPDLCLRTEGGLKQYYAPFDHRNTDAKIVILGLTPGRQQSELAWTVGRRLFAKGVPLSECMSEALRIAAFCGSMRSKIVEMCDFAGVNEFLSMRTTADLWEKTHFPKAQFISLMPFPVFLNDTNYSGSNPNAARSTIAKQSFLIDCLPVLLDLNCPTIVLGRSAETAIETWKSTNSQISKIDWHFVPHTSGNSPGRADTFIRREKSASNMSEREVLRILGQRKSCEERFRVYN
jgi:hypothetical protein